MASKDELEEKVKAFARDSWGEISDGTVIPAPETLTFGNSGTRIEGCILYADLRRSTEMVDELTDTRAAEYYKAFLHCAATIIKDNEGEVTAYDGDRVMGIFLGGSQAHNAVRAGLRINFAVQTIVNPAFENIYKENHRKLQHTVGIDCGKLLVAKTGVRIDSDLVFVGSSANYASKLNSFPNLDANYQTRITTDVYDRLTDSLKKMGETLIWDGPYNDLIKRNHYRSSYWFTIA